MANRQSLKDLQARLAQRLSAAKTEASSGSWLAVQADGQRYLVPLVQAGEIFAWSPLHAVPYTKPWYVGVVSLRGGLYGVVDLAQLLKQDALASDRVTSESRLLSLHTALGVNAVLWVDRLLGLRNPSQFAALGERPQDAPAFVTRCLIDSQAQSWLELDLQKLAANPEFLSIAV